MLVGINNSWKNEKHASENKRGLKERLKAIREIRSTYRLYIRAGWLTPLDRTQGDWCSAARFALQTGCTHTHAHARASGSPHPRRLCRQTLVASSTPVTLEMLSLPVTTIPGFSSLLKTLERQKMSVDSMKRPLMMAALNGLYVARMPVPESPAEDVTKANTDERVRSLLTL